SPSGLLTVTLHELSGFSASSKNSDLLEGGAFLPRLDSYVVLDYDHSQATFMSVKDIGNRRMYWSRVFNVTRAAELTIHIFLRLPKLAMGSQDILLGTVGLKPFDGDIRNMDSMWLQVREGNAKMRVGVQYTPLEHVDQDESAFVSQWVSLSPPRLATHLVVRKDTGREYAQKTFYRARLRTGLEKFPTHHAFIAPLAFRVQSPKRAYLLAPFASGGHLFSHLQRTRRFDVHRARMYAAEIVTAIEYLHDAHQIFGWVKPSNVLLDSLGHVTLCGFGLFRSQVQLEDGHSIPRSQRPEYPAPECLLDEGNEDASRAADWWTLGIFLHEMLTGLPLFYSEDPDDIRHKILHHQAQSMPFDPSIPPSAADILTRLLAYQSTQRLGIHGATEVKEHPFFENIDWQRLLQRRYEALFKPQPFSGPFEQLGAYNPPPAPPSEWQVCSGFQYKRPVFRKPDSSAGSGAIMSLEKQDVAASIHEKDEWDLVWDADCLAFSFHDRSTGVRYDLEPAASLLDGPHPAPLPSRAQKLDALEAALQGHHDRAVYQLLQDYGPLDLNTEIFRRIFQPTPIQWAATEQNLGLVELFLEKGADTNYGRTPSPAALVTAVQLGNRALVQILLEAPTDGPILTRALAQAVKRQDMAIVHLLLAIDGIRCDFEPPDGPLPGPFRFDLHPMDPEQYMPPLVWAAKLGDLALARLLLAHGANPNIGYHVTGERHSEFSSGPEPIEFTCGRPVQLAMERGHRDIVRLLLDSGADINLPQPDWPVASHTCKVVPRPAYQKVTASLREEAK
ncbi:kinase-like protein, partial [Thozetella sp. PMI_491]